MDPNTEIECITVTSEEQVIEQPTTQPEEQLTEQPEEQLTEQPTTHSEEQLTEQSEEQPSTHSEEQLTEQPVVNSVENDLEILGHNISDKDTFEEEVVKEFSEMDTRIEHLSELISDVVDDQTVLEGRVSNQGRKILLLEGVTIDQDSEIEKLKKTIVAQNTEFKKANSLLKGRIGSLETEIKNQKKEKYSLRKKKEEYSYVKVIFVAIILSITAAALIVKFY